MNSAVLGICLAISIFFVTAIKTPTTEQTAITRLRYYTQMLMDKKVPYVWGGYWIFGADCSGAVALVLKLAGIGGYPRTTSLRMWLTWPHKKKIVSNEEIWKTAQFPNVMFFTFPTKKVKRPFGHTCFDWANDTKSNLMIAEASSSADYFKETLIKKGDFRDKHIVGLLVLNLTPGL
jgi:hypothetical protein